MVGGEIVEASVITHRMVIAASVGAIAWKMVTLFLGFPTSSSRALLGGLIGAALSQDGMAAVKFSGLRAVWEALLFSPIIGFVLGYLIIVAIYWAMFRITGGVANKLFCRIQVISAGLMAFSHGSNDVQKVMGIITLALVSGGFWTVLKSKTK